MAKEEGEGGEADVFEEKKVAGYKRGVSCLFVFLLFVSLLRTPLDGDGCRAGSSGPGFRTTCLSAPKSRP